MESNWEIFGVDSMDRKIAGKKNRNRIEWEEIIYFNLEPKIFWLKRHDWFLKFVQIFDFIITLSYKCLHKRYSNYCYIEVFLLKLFNCICKFQCYQLMQYKYFRKRICRFRRSLCRRIFTKYQTQETQTKFDRLPFTFSFGRFKKKKRKLFQYRTYSKPFNVSFRGDNIQDQW